MPSHVLLLLLLLTQMCQQNGVDVDQKLANELQSLFVSLRVRKGEGEEQEEDMICATRALSRLGKALSGKCRVKVARLYSILSRSLSNGTLKI